MIYETMLNKNEQEKFGVYKLLTSLPEGLYSKNGLIGEVSFSYNRLCAVLEEIHRDLEGLTEERPQLLQGGKVAICSNMLLLQDYGTYLLKESLTYKFLFSLLEEKEQTIEAFCDKFQVSESYVRRSIKKLIAFINGFDVFINISAMRIGGDERIIRILFVFFIWACTFGKEFPAPTFSEAAIVSALEPILKHPPKTTSPYNNQLRRVHMEILHRRIANGHMVKDDQGYDLLLIDNYNDFTPFQNLFNLERPEANSEARFLGFLAFHGPTYSFEDDALFNLPKELLKEQAPQIFDFLMLFKQKILQPLLSSYPDSKSRRLLEANVVNIYYNYLVFKKRQPFFMLMEREETQENSMILPIVYQRIVGFFTEFAVETENGWLEKCIPDISLLMTRLIIPTLEKHQKSIKLNVAIVSEDNYIYINNVKSLLADLSFIRLLPYTPANEKKLDLLIYPSKIFQRETETITTLTLPLPTLKEDFFGVYKEVKEIYEAKLRQHFLKILNSQGE